MKKVSLFILSIISVVAMMSSCAQRTPEEKMEKAIAHANKECPMDLGNGMSLASVTEEENNIVYSFEINEETLGKSVKTFNRPEVKNTMRKSLIANFLSEDNKLIKLCKELNYNFIIRFVGKPSEEVAEITVNADEL